ncbi:MAG: general secretion pathway protein GspN [Comamonas sp. SCN 67-35]|jgi:general secretion pathway protein N|uniref:type II secretion system protein N n=1 Tax=unclassified Comamonas TaxID=2638500 RepID=UPI0008684645|nr:MULTISPECIES: type II secretion system protein N [unclassified Comamonas]MBN9329678.1 type II secretion system protein N [Comamonas sp.]ODU38127.1 MAG: general secretion pathway protein GspN [Comamonas sp. SCN 67-35]OJX03623.1 MAG: general secretion pathway protein GspN [Burkholderiales bacterium 66-26]
MPARRTTIPSGAPWRWALAGLLLGLLPTLAVQAPARWLASAVQRTSQGQLVLANAQGTLWNGSALLQLTGGSGSSDALTLPGTVHWRLRPAWEGLHAELSADCCTPTPVQLAVALGWGSARGRVDDHQSRWPAALLAGLGTPWNTVQLQGQLALSTTGLTLAWAHGRTEVGGQLQLDLLGMSSRLSTLHPIGSYRVSLHGGEATRLTLTTLDGALRLSGSGQWVGQRLRFTGEATAAPGSEAVLANLLNIIGRRSGARSVITIG